MLNQILAVAAGGAMGAVGRLLMYEWVKSIQLRPIWGTFLANMAGCFLIGLILKVSAPWPEWLRWMIITGVLGAFTTFSTFCLEIDALITANKVGLALLYGLVSISFGLSLIILAKKL